MGEKDDGLGLSLSLGCARNEPAALKLKLVPFSSSHSMQNLHQKNSWNELFQSSGKLFISSLSQVQNEIKNLQADLRL